MKNWLWLGKNPNKIVDNPNIVNFLSYESLALSSLQDSLNIEPKNILLVDDKQSVFTKKFKVVTRDLEVVEEDRTVENELFDILNEKKKKKRKHKKKKDKEEEEVTKEEENENNM